MNARSLFFAQTGRESARKTVFVALTYLAYKKCDVIGMNGEY
jgi:hypothetical protein